MSEFGSDEDDQDVGPFYIPLAAKPLAVVGTSSESPNPFVCMDLHEAGQRAAAKLGITWPKAHPKTTMSSYEGKLKVNLKTITS